MNNDLISRQAVIDHINKKREEHLESADLISRQAAILALAEQIMESALMDNPTTASTDINRYRPIAELSLRDVPSAQPVIRTEMSSANDTISRQAAIDALDKRFDSIPMEQTAEILQLRKDLRDLPSAQPERKRGQWIYNSPVTMKCDQCGLVIKDWDWHRFKFCPNCDCDMRGGQNG